MPLQRFDTAPVPRPSGLVPPVAPLDGVTELRLHGVGGTTPQGLLGDDAPQQVSGDRIAGFYRTADVPGAAGVPGRHVEAYSWGGLTSRSGSRVLWLLLFPFALANMAGWMCTPAVHRDPVRFRLHRTAVRWVALAITLNLLLLVAIIGMDLIGYQCGGLRDCAGAHWYLRPLTDPLAVGHPARRALIGALLPALLVVLLAVLTLRSIRRYELVRPPGRTGTPPRDAGPAHSSAQPGRGLPDPAFWDGRRSALDLGCLHVGAGFAFVALLLGYVVRRAAVAAGAPLHATGLATAGYVLGGLAVLAAVLLLVADACPPAAPAAVLGAGALALVAAGWFAAVQPGYSQAFGYLPGMREGANLTLGLVFGALALALLATVLGGWRRGMFALYGPFVTLTLSVLALNVVLLAVLTRVADLLGRVSASPYVPATAPDRAALYVYPMAARAVQYLTVLPLAMLLLFVGYELVTYWRAGANARERSRIREWYRANVTRPAGEDDWHVSTMADERVRRQRLAQLWGLMAGSGWEAGIARARRVARMPHDADVLLTAMAVLGAGLLVAIQIRYWIFHRLPWGTQWTYTVGSYLATGIPLLLILVLRRGWRNLASRRRIGVLWDITTFWPRAYHPLAPPAYPERAVPELQRRLWRLHDSGGRVVLTAHSQGTVLAAAALLQPENRPTDGRVALVTFGSPLRTLYGWAFPAYFSAEVLRGLESRGVYAWRNFYYRTDYIGGPALSDGADQAGQADADAIAGRTTDADRSGSAERAADAAGTGRIGGADQGAGVDVELPDPVSNWYIFGQPRPTATRHSGYWTDAAVWQAVDELASDLAGDPARGPVRPATVPEPR
ncbi:hypothetical protein ACFFWC_00280 [Plantactinospora siamensis]|uniref:Integral membrane protein n=1 Tax=Plantactinospora siamensis TaxID=555372 RepID=A0ABV6NTU3_9ACTN